MLDAIHLHLMNIIHDLLMKILLQNMAFVESVDTTYARFVLASLAMKIVREAEERKEAGERPLNPDVTAFEDDTLQLEGTVLAGAVRAVPLCRQIKGIDGPFSPWEPAAASSGKE
jgi:hypothetical protein